MISKRILDTIVLTLSPLVTMAIAADQHEGAVTHAYYDKANTGAYHFEKKLNPSVVNGNNFGLLYTRVLDGRPTQPLYVPNLTMADGQVHNVMFVTSMAGSVYAFDADDPAANAPLWKTVVGSRPSVFGGNVQPNFGAITGTPAIDLATKTLYVVHRTDPPAGVTAQWVFYLNALDIITGQHRSGSPNRIDDQSAGTGMGNVNGIIDFKAMSEKQGCGLRLHDGIVYTAFAGHGSNGPWHGYLFAHRMDNLQKVAVWNSTLHQGSTMMWFNATWKAVPNAGAGGIWQSYTAPSVDSEGNIYVVTGEGDYREDTAGNPLNFSMSVVKLRLNGNQFQVVDWFTPWDWNAWNMVDADMSTAAVLVPNSDMLIVGRKGGEVLGPYQAGLYLLSRTTMGHRRATKAEELAQTVVASDPFGTVDPLNTHRKNFAPNSPIYWEGPQGKVVFTWATGDYLRAWGLSPAGLTPLPIGDGPTLQGYPQASPSNGMVLTENGYNSNTAIIWATTTIADGTIRPPVVARAYDAATLQEIWNSRMNGTRDEVGLVNGLYNSIVAGGKLFVGSILPTNAAHVKVYGLRRPPVADAGANQTISCLLPGQNTTVTLNGNGSSDPDGDPLTYQWKDEAGTVLATTAVTTVSVPVSTTRTFTLAVTDNQNLSNSVPVTVTTVADTTPPTLVTKGPASLWPPNNTMRAFSVTTDVVQSASDTCDASVNAGKVRLVSISADEGTSSDVQISSPTAFSVRSQRNGNGDGRVYTIIVSVTDAAGNTRMAPWQIMVPHDQGIGGAIAGTAVYTVTP